jgi:hypothetical protein
MDPVPQHPLSEGDKKDTVELGISAHPAVFGIKSSGGIVFRTGPGLRANNVNLSSVHVFPVRYELHLHIRT